MPLYRIQGSGPEAAFAAAFLALKTRGTQTAIQFTIVPSDTPVPVILGSEAQKALQTMGISLPDMMRFCRGTIAVGARYTGKGGRTRTYPFPAESQSLYGEPIYRICSLPGADLPDFADLFGSTYLADHGKACLPDRSQNFDYRLVLNRPAFQTYLTRAAEHYGAQKDATETADFILFFPTGSQPTQCHTQATEELSSRLDYSLDGDCLTLNVNTQDKVYQCEVELSDHSRAQVEDDEGLGSDTTLTFPTGPNGLLTVDHMLFEVTAATVAEVSKILPTAQALPLVTPMLRQSLKKRIWAARSVQRLYTLESPSASWGDAELDRRIALFDYRGHIPVEDRPLVNQGEWYCRFHAAGLRPASVEPLLAAPHLGEIRAALSKRADECRRWAADQKSQRDYLKSIGALATNVAQVGAS